jgi:TPP-dependent pyruvate/acetoin dehydrogenase alpha subunit
MTTTISPARIGAMAIDIAKGGDPQLMMAEIFGRSTGYCKGKGGSMHIADVELGILGANGIVGGGPPLATGAAIACQHNDNKSVAVCFFGDGASNQGTTHEAMNLAACWKLPVVFMNENNLYGISCCTDKSTCVSDLADRAASYDIPGVVVDGNDVIAVYEAAMPKGIERARKGGGPSWIECKTYRHRGHFEGDPCNYRTDEELDEWKAKDPLPRMEQKLLDNKVLSQDELDGIKARVKRRWKTRSPLPNPARCRKSPSFWKTSTPSDPDKAGQLFCDQ